MSIDQTSIILVAVIAGYFSRKLPRAVLWISCLAGIYLFTGWYWAMDFPKPALIAAILDASLAVEIINSTNSRKERWQLWTALIVQTMIVINIVYIATGHLLHIESFHQSSLELLNYAAFVVIGGTAIIEQVGRHEANTFYHNLHNLRAYLRAVLSQSKTSKGQR